jgi:hypothetical protein
MSISIDLTGRLTRVTGAGRGIGTGIVSGGLPFHA